MKPMRVTCIVIFLCLVGLRMNAAEGLALQDSAPSYIDNDKDGVNDRFVDANGDGVNDLTGKSYPHHFQFRDRNGDGINDLWTDSDGDGVNDRLGEIIKEKSRWIDRDGDGIMDENIGQLRGRELRMHVLDVDADGCNDITGSHYTGRDLFGYRYGKVDEEMDVTDTQFVDDNHDGMNDRFFNRDRNQGQEHRGVDLFFDADGDGIADDRGFQRMHRQRSGKGKKK